MTLLIFCRLQQGESELVTIGGNVSISDNCSIYSSYSNDKDEIKKW